MTMIIHCAPKTTNFTVWKTRLGAGPKRLAEKKYASVAIVAKLTRQMMGAAFCVLRLSQLAGHQLSGDEARQEQDLRLVVGPAHHEAEERKVREGERIEGLANPYRHEIHEMPSRIARRAQRRHFGRRGRNDVKFGLFGHCRGTYLKSKCWCLNKDVVWILGGVHSLHIMWGVSSRLGVIGALW
jgi:hypothetical protein